MMKEEAQQFKARWKLVNDVIAEEMRHTSTSLKLHQLSLMYKAAHALGWTERLREGEEEVRKRWQCLKEKLHA